MSKTIDSLVPDIESLFTSGSIFSEENIALLSSKIGSEIRERFREYSNERKPTLSLSKIGKPLRQLWFEVASGLKPEPLPAPAKFKFLYGGLIESLVIVLAIEAGHKVERLQEEVSVDGVPGHIDCFIDGVLVDVKSASTFSFNRFKDGSLRENDLFGYVGQLAGYSTACGGVDGAFLAVDKTLGHLTLCHFTKEELHEYNVRRKIQETRATLARDVPPEQLCAEPVGEGRSGNLKLPALCSYCSFKFPCWKDANEGKGLRTFYYSGGPVYLTKVAKEPRVQEAGKEVVNLSQE